MICCTAAQTSSGALLVTGPACNEETVAAAVEYTAAYPPIAELLANGGRELVVHTIVTGGGSVIETLKGLEAVVLHFPDTVRVVVWTNEFFGPVRYENTAFEEMAIYREAKPRISGRITLKELNRRTFGANLATLLERKLTFSEALSSNSAFNTVERQRLAMIQRELFDQLAHVI